jgi:hypothetical protein
MMPEVEGWVCQNSKYIDGHGNNGRHVGLLDLCPRNLPPLNTIIKFSKWKL